MRAAFAESRQCEGLGRDRKDSSANALALATLGTPRPRHLADTKDHFL